MENESPEAHHDESDIVSWRFGLYSWHGYSNFIYPLDSIFFFYLYIHMYIHKYTYILSQLNVCLYVCVTYRDWEIVYNDEFSWRRKITWFIFDFLFSFLMSLVSSWFHVNGWHLTTNYQKLSVYLHVISNIRE